MKRVILAVLLVGGIGCSNNQVNIPELCEKGIRICNLADQICIFDEKVAQSDPCKRRAEVCDPLRQICVNQDKE